MKLIRPTYVLLAALVGTASVNAQTAPAPATPAAPAPAPAPRQRTSPHDTISARIDTCRLTVV